MKCSNLKHKKYYRYDCKECFGKNKECNICKHNIYTCTKCWKPVKIINGMYWFVK